MIEIPLQHLPNQELIMILDGQNVTLHVYQRGLADVTHMYLDVSVGSTIVQQAAPLIPRVGILSTPKDFAGQFRLVDTAAKPDWQTNPTYDELGTAANQSRYRLYYLTAEEDSQVEAARTERLEAAALAELATGTAVVTDSPIDPIASTDTTEQEDGDG